MEEGRLGVSRFLPLFLGPGNLRLGIPDQQLFSVWHVGWPDGIADGFEAGGDAQHPEHGGPEGVGEQVDQLLLESVVGVGVDDESFDGTPGDGTDDEENVEEMHVALTIPEDNPKTSEDAGTSFGVALVDVTLLTSGTRERHWATAEP